MLGSYDLKYGKRVQDCALLLSISLQTITKRLVPELNPNLATDLFRSTLLVGCNIQAFICYLFLISATCTADEQIDLLSVERNERFVAALS